VGGSTGNLLTTILGKHPAPRGILFDLAHVVRDAPALIAQRGLTDRVQIEAGSFFERVPAGADAYILSHVIHDWNDERAVAILGSCRRVMSASGKVLIVEGVYPPRIDQTPESRGAAANDANMLVSTGGRERSEAEFRSLYDAAGFTLTRIVPTPTRVSVIEGTPAR
jgi:hypothetical protein